MWLGIDFGTSYSSAAFLADGRLRLIKEPLKQSFSFPSSVYITADGQVLVGQAAENRKRKEPFRYQREFKRDLGSGIPFQLGEHQRLPEELVAAVLGQLKAEADRAAGEPFANVLLTVPATYEAHRRELMVQAGRQAGFERVELLEEPVAAALYYAYQANGSAPRAGRETLLVYDLGGGTFDAALVERQGEEYRFLGYPVGLPELGGIDFDRLIFGDLVEQAGNGLGDLLAPDNEAGLLARFLLADTCQTVKHQLSVTGEHEEVLYLPQVGPVSYSLERAAFEGMIDPLLAQTIQSCRQLVESAGLEWEQVDRVLLVGGSCRIPLVERLLERELSRPVAHAEDLELVVALGAALHGPELERLDARPAQPQASARADAGPEEPAPATAAPRDPVLTDKDLAHLGMLGDPVLGVLPNDPVSRAITRLVVGPQARREQPDGVGDVEVTLWNTLRDHRKQINSVAFSPDGSLLASGSGGYISAGDVDIRLWRMPDGRLHKRVSGHRGTVWSVAFSPDGDLIAYAPNGTSVCLWRISDGQQQSSLAGHSNLVKSVAFSPDGSLLASASVDKKVWLWQVSDGRLLHTFHGHGHAVVGVAFSPNGALLASASRDKTVRIWSLAAGHSRHIVGHPLDVRAVAFSPNGSLVASGCVDGKVRLWRMADGRLHATLEGHTNWVQSLAFSPYDDLLASGSLDGTIRVWQVSTGRIVAIRVERDNPVHSVAFSPDGRLLASGSGDQAVRIWRVRTVPPKEG